MSQKVDKNISEKIILNLSSVADFKQLLRNNYLSGSDKLLYSYLFVLSLDNADNSSILNVSAKQAMIELNISFVQYYRSRQVLVKQGYIQCYSKALEPLEPPASSSRIEVCRLIIDNLVDDDSDEEDQDDEYESDDYDQDDDIDSDDENEKENKEQQHQNIKLQTNKNKLSKDITSNLVTPKPNASKPNLTITQLREMYPSDDPSYDSDFYINERFNDELTMCNPKKSLTPEEIYQSSMLYSVIPSTKIPWNLRLKNFNKLDSDKRNLFLKGMQDQQLQEFNLMAEYKLLIDNEPF